MPGKTGFVGWSFVFWVQSSGFRVSVQELYRASIGHSGFSARIHEFEYMVSAADRVVRFWIWALLGLEDPRLVTQGLGL